MSPETKEAMSIWASLLDPDIDYAKLALLYTNSRERLSWVSGNLILLWKSCNGSGIFTGRGEWNIVGDNHPRDVVLLLKQRVLLESLVRRFMTEDLVHGLCLHMRPLNPATSEIGRVILQTFPSDWLLALCFLTYRLSRANRRANVYTAYIHAEVKEAIMKAMDPDERTAALALTLMDSAVLNLSKSDSRKVDKALADTGSSDDILVSKFNIDIARETFRRLNDGLPGEQSYLDDELINFYIELVNARSSSDKSLPRVYCFNTHFVDFLIGEEEKGSRITRWTTRAGIDLFKLDKLLVPVNHRNVHWGLLVINFKAKRFEYYDSLGWSDDGHISRLRRYIQLESVAKRGGKGYDLSGWTEFRPTASVPVQKNEVDCGVFACKYAEYVSVDREFDFNQSHIPLFRRQIALEILNSKLVNRP